MNMKKAVLLLLTLVLVFACTAVASAEEYKLGDPYLDGYVTDVPKCGTRGDYVVYYTDASLTTVSKEETNYTRHFYILDEPLAHAWELKKTTPSTCQVQGTEEYECSLCGAKDTKVLELAEHVNEWFPVDPSAVGPKCQGSYEIFEKCENCGKETEAAHQWTIIIPHAFDEDTHVEPIIPATCTMEGSYFVKCTECGTTEERTEAINPAKHNVGKWVTQFPATCTTEGREHRICFDCGEILDGRPIPVLGHDTQKPGEGEVKKEATCGEDGLEILKCLRDGCDYTVESVIPATGNHKIADDPVIVKQPTCTETGLADYLCTVCGQVVVDDATLPMKEHEIEYADVVEPTCTEEGRRKLVCKVCGNNVTKDYGDVDLIGKYNGEDYEIFDIVEHPWGDWTQINPPEDDEDGATLGYWMRQCTVCGAYDWKTGEGNGDTLVKENVKEATCTEEGSYDLVRYNDKGQEMERTPMTEPALGHDFSVEIEVEATCTEDGSRTTVCVRCQIPEGEPEVIPAGHKLVVNETPATCGADGQTVTTCENCDYIETVVIPATGEHDVEVVTTEATCGADGQTVTTCKNCDYTETEVIPATGDHDVEVVTTEATCAVDGKKVTTCKNCDYTETEVIPATGKHDVEVVTTEATCATAGQKVTTCKNCDYTETEVIPATGKHTLQTVPAKEATASKAGNKEYQICTVCNKAMKDGVEINPADMIIAPVGGLSDEDGAFKYYDQAGEVMTSYTGMVNFEGGKFFVRNGILDTKVNGVQSPDAKNFYFFSLGRICSEYSGLAEYDGHWFVVENGVFQLGYNGLYSWNGGTFWVAAGQKTDVDGLVQTEKGWLYFEDGCVMAHTGLVSYDGEIFYVVDGKLQENFTGTVKDFNGTEFSVVNGMVK